MNYRLRVCPAYKLKDLRMAKFNLTKRELKALLKNAQWVPFTAQLRKQYSSFKVLAPAEFADIDGVYMVRANGVINYISSNGHYWGEFSPQ